MRASEILRKMADLLDAKEGGESASTEITNRPDQTDVPAGEPTDTNGIEQQAQVNVATMVPPLQQKLDLMKKMAGVEGPCTSCGCSPCECPEPESDELAIIKQNAGIKPVVMAIADEDEPFEG
jgi:hypothetical protein